MTTSGKESGGVRTRDLAAMPAGDTEALPRGRNVVAVIGIDSYEHWPTLNNAVGDANGVRGLLLGLGFLELVPPLFDAQCTQAAVNSFLLDDLASP